MKQKIIWLNERQSKKLREIARKQGKTEYAIIKEALLEKYPILS